MKHLVHCVTLALCVLSSLTAGGCRQSSDDAPSEAKEITTKLGVPMVLIPAGEFTMGSANGPKDESPRHKVSVSAFAMDKYEVTQDQFKKLQIPDPSQFKNPKRPVEQIRWSDAALFCNERSRFEGLEPCYNETTFECNFNATGYRLPTEAEWEYAARGGFDGDYGFDGSVQQLKNYACYAPTATKKTDLVGRKKPNAFGLHDMLGNVSEWCYDVYEPNYYANSIGRDPRGPAAGKKRVMRGGSWKSPADGCRVTTRYAEIPGITDACFARNTFGFRCVRKVSAEEKKMLNKVGP